MKEIFKEGSWFRPFLLSIALMSIGYGLYKGVIDNYLAEIVGMGEFDRGVSEFFRELPGLALIFILAIFYKFSAEKMYKMGLIVMLVGMVMQSVIPPSKVLVILAMFLFSYGEHIQLGMKSTLSLEYSRPGAGGRALGYQTSMQQIGNLVGFVAVIALFSITAMSGAAFFQSMFVVAAVFIAVATLVSFRLTSESKTDENKRRFYFRKKFTKYYMLEMFYGARKQVFFTFGPYVLILFYGADARLISILFAVSAIACFVFSPIVGKIIDRLGYKPVMIGDTLILVIVCFFYGFAHHLFDMHTAMIVCCVNYVLDSVISLAAMASSVYVQDISDDKNEMRATISTGLSVNHLVTVLIALFGGWIWHALGIETLFIVSAVLGLCNSAYAATIKVVKREKTI
ncbi:MFS transporter [Fibrobacter sp.]|uniref:MFS transporter n=1 Tax=Fibrobacter sp. TaxID=35828 RepID=UPI00388F32F3